MSQLITPGQRWMSEMEPELGLGIVLSVEYRRVKIRFAAGECERQYAIETAPLKRVRFRIGDRIKDRNGLSIKITNIRDENGLLIYSGNERHISENDLNDAISFTGPEERLFNGQGDPSPVFEMRYETLKLRHLMARSRVRGMTGGRIDLIPHQLYIANEVVNRQIPRALLADEVGLGKTIEACLILHRLLISRRISRVLILVPEALVHQWFVELLRRFNLMFRIIDDEYCFALEENEPDVNPFMEDTLALCSIDFLSNDEDRWEQAINAGWDMLVVDEAHHLKDDSPAYDLVEDLSLLVKGLLLLTATPEQLGVHSHFERLRLLDPARYYSYEEFLKESENYHQTAAIANKLIDAQPMSPTEETVLGALFPDNPRLFQENLEALRQNDETARRKIINELLDRHGMGRVMFRNTRAAMKNFPKRQVIPAALSAGNDPELRARLAEEFACDSSEPPYKMDYQLNNDPRVEWLARLITDLGEAKVLLICRTRSKAQAIFEALMGKINIKAGVFHENMTLIQRDRNAAWFSETDGARALICSEIGSEGRNFQFAHHLVLFDLPLNPELLEQRIGRLDRIGQKETINIHVPFITGSAYEALYRWYHEGMNAFEKNVQGVQQVYEKFHERLRELVTNTADLSEKNSFTEFIHETNAFCVHLADTLEKGRDRLLEMHSFRADEAEKLVTRIQDIDAETALDELMHKVWEFYGIQSDDLAPRTFLLMPGDLRVDAFPGFRGDGMSVTFDRVKAMSREDIEFLSRDHPMVTGAVDLLIGSEKGNSAFAVCTGGKLGGPLLEVVYVLECVAPLTLMIDRFLPATPVRVVIDHEYQIRTDFTEEWLRKRIKTLVNVQDLLEDIVLKNEMLPEMMEQGRIAAEARGQHIITAAKVDMETKLTGEIERLLALQRVNHYVSDIEITMIREELKQLRALIEAAGMRLDSLRLILPG